MSLAVLARKTKTKQRLKSTTCGNGRNRNGQQGRNVGFVLNMTGRGGGIGLSGMSYKQRGSNCKQGVGCSCKGCCSGNCNTGQAGTCCTADKIVLVKDVALVIVIPVKPERVVLRIKLLQRREETIVGNVGMEV
jgi:hypothetical protein